MIDSIRKGVVIILSSNSHVNVMECIIIIKNVMRRKKGNSVVLVNNTIALLLLSFAFFFLFLLTLSSRTHTHTHSSIDLNQRKKKRE